MISTPLVLGCLWVLFAAGTAMLPMRYQAYPGVPLLLSVPVLLVWIGMDVGWPWVCVGLFAFISMFRRPLTALVRWMLGLPVEVPKEFQR